MDEYYKKYMLVYFDDFLHLTHDSLAGMERLNQVYRLKEGLEKVQMEDGGGGGIFFLVDMIQFAKAFVPHHTAVVSRLCFVHNASNTRKVFCANSNLCHVVPGKFTGLFFAQFERTLVKEATSTSSSA